MRRNILLGVTGSVAAVKTQVLVKALNEIGDVKIVATDSGAYFLPHQARHPAETHQCMYLTEDDDLNAVINGPRVPVYRDKDEWTYDADKLPSYKLGDPVLHIELRAAGPVVL